MNIRLGEIEEVDLGRDGVGEGLGGKEERREESKRTREKRWQKSNRGRGGGGIRGFKWIVLKYQGNIPCC